MGMIKNATKRIGDFGNEVLTGLEITATWANAELAISVAESIEESVNEASSKTLTVAEMLLAGSKAGEIVSAIKPEEKKSK